MKEYSPEILPTIGCKHEVLALMSLPSSFQAFSKIQFDLYYSLSMLRFDCFVIVFRYFSLFE